MTSNADELAFENAIKSLEATAASLATHLEIDSAARRSYAKQIAAVSDGLRSDVRTGKLTWLQAAEQAHQTRNLVMEAMRTRSTPVGRAWAEKLKPKGHPFNCIFRAKLDTHSTPNWTLIPRQTGHPFQRKLDTDSAPNWTV